MTPLEIVLFGLVVERIVALTIFIGKSIKEHRAGKPARNAEKAAKRKAVKVTKLAKKHGMTEEEVIEVMAQATAIEAQARQEKNRAKLLKKFK